MLAALLVACRPTIAIAPSATVTTVATATSTVTLTPTVTATATVTPTATVTLTPLPTPIPIGGGTGRIAFTRASGIWVMSIDGTETRQLTHARSLYSDGISAWSPDGSQIAFDRILDGGGSCPYERMYVIRADGATITPLADHAGQPAWSPDGMRIAFSSTRWQSVGPNRCQSLGIDVYVISSDGTGRTQLTNHPKRDCCPLWSSDGRQIYFRSNRDGYIRYYVMNADGSDQQPVTAAWSSGYGLDWSPDGTRVVFAGLVGNNESRIFVSNADGSDMQRLTDGPGLERHPAWSPDGTLIAFCSGLDSNREIYIVNADGTERTNLTNDPADGCYPTWQP